MGSWVGGASAALPRPRCLRFRRSLRRFLLRPPRAVSCLSSVSASAFFVSIFSASAFVGSALSVSAFLGAAFFAAAFLGAAFLGAAFASAFGSVVGSSTSGRSGGTGSVSRVGPTFATSVTSLGTSTTTRVLCMSPATSWRPLTPA